MTEKVNILQFMVIRPANLPASASVRRSYIRDDSLQRTGYADADLFSEGSASEIGKLVYTSVFCSGLLLPVRAVRANLENTGSILEVLLQTLPYYDAPCPNPSATSGRQGGPRCRRHTGEHGQGKGMGARKHAERTRARDQAEL